VLVKIVIAQSQLGQKLTLEEKIHIFKQKPDFICLPEYCLVDPLIFNHYQASENSNRHLNYLTRLSDELSCCLIAGSIIEAVGDDLFNTSYVINRGLRVGRYRKRYLMEGEIKGGIIPGQSNLVVQVDGVRIGIMLCSDVFSTAIFREHFTSKVDIIFCPTASPFRPDDSITDKEYRDNDLYVGGSRTAASFVVKSCGVGTLFGKPLQGRSLLAAPWGLIRRVSFNTEKRKRIITETLDINEIREFKSKLALFQCGDNPGSWNPVLQTKKSPQ